MSLCLLSRGLLLNAVCRHWGMQPCKWIIQACDPLLISSGKSRKKEEQNGRRKIIYSIHQLKLLPKLYWHVQALRTRGFFLNLFLCLFQLFWATIYQTFRDEHSNKSNYKPTCIVWSVTETTRQDIMKLKLGFLKSSKTIILNLGIWVHWNQIQTPEKMQLALRWTRQTRGVLTTTKHPYWKCGQMNLLIISIVCLSRVNPDNDWSHHVRRKEKSGSTVY